MGTPMQVIFSVGVQRPAPLDEQALEDLRKARAHSRICHPAPLDEPLHGFGAAGRKREALTLDPYCEYHLHGSGSIPGHLAGDHFPEYHRERVHVALLAYL